MLGKEAMHGSPVKFHTAHKLTLLAHSPKHCTEMGRLVAAAGKWDCGELTSEYGVLLMEGLSVMGTRGKHVNVLQYLMGSRITCPAKTSKSSWASSRTTGRDCCR
jgi:uncharacterized protein YbgA (DUF1722 family)